MRMGIMTFIGKRPTLGPRLPIQPGGGSGGGSGSGAGSTCPPDDQGGGGYCRLGPGGSLPNGPDSSGPPTYSKAVAGPCPVEDFVEQGD